MAQTKSVLWPSLEEKYYPGWNVSTEGNVAFMQEHDTGKSYYVPVPRFTKAAWFLRLENVLSGMSNTATICRCQKGCGTKMSVDDILEQRSWFFEWETHEQAKAELARLMADNLRKHHQMYWFNKAGQVLPTSESLIHTQLGLSKVLRMGQWL